MFPLTQEQLEFWTLTACVAVIIGLIWRSGWWRR